ncbi:Peroxisome biogenesis factor 10 [Smittium culicis]|uniref:RING-type E3 ubiquitin transferase n=1 Tax=Smittium culicis TaxID=133412 RepID=A0A1R1YGU3_9FUNG|nr:Peroxisome biogenesis factor 10 [Smittium culicis]
MKIVELPPNDSDSTTNSSPKINHSTSQDFENSTCNMLPSTESSPQDVNDNLPFENVKPIRSNRQNTFLNNLRNMDPESSLENDSNFVANQTSITSDLPLQDQNQDSIHIPEENIDTSLTTNPSESVLSQKESKVRGIKTSNELKNFSNIFHPVYATQADIVRANQKDCYYEMSLSSQIEEVAAILFGNRFANRNKSQIFKLGILSYYALTVMRGLSTLGEEYVSIIQFDPKSKKYPSTLKRFVSILMCVYGAEFFIKASKKLLNKIYNPQLPNRLPQQSESSTLPFFGKYIDRVKNYFSSYDIITKFNSIPGFSISKLNSIIIGSNLAVFYLFGKYYQLSKRLSGIQYIKLRNLNEGELQSGYEILGLMMLIQFGFRAASTISNHFLLNLNKQEVSTKSPISSESKSDSLSSDISINTDRLTNSENHTCSLCLELLESSTITRCGHVFCWECLYEWSTKNDVCPLCRQSIKQSQIMPIYCY